MNAKIDKFLKDNKIKPNESGLYLMGKGDLNRLLKYCKVKNYECKN